MAAPGAQSFVPDEASLDRLREAVHGCRGCDLYGPATQAVFGSGSQRASAMLVGEQPGDREDREGEPFVGPAGRELDRALVAAGIERKQVYVTNAVKHFRFQERGKRRIHQRPSREQVRACRPWLEAELARVRPRVLVCLGATAAQALLERKVVLSRERGRPVDSELARYVFVTAHPSSILRARDAREAAREALIADLIAARKLLAA
jgi:DNA polymerase